ncbi:MAG: NAD-dependent succinate-semialdehyde dehydrogenase [Sphingomonadales bacterium]
MKLERKDLLRQQGFVGGLWSDADTGETFDVVNPATGAVIATVPDMSVSETRRAIESADRARHDWAVQPAKARAVVLRKLFSLLMQHQEDLAQLMTAEQGKPLTESRGEIAYAASFIEWFAEEGKRTYGDVIPNHMPGKRILVIKQPVGVCAAITPWNFPMAMITRKIGPALAAGCSIVVKPAEATPLSALALCVLAQEAGLPGGLLSCITASKGAGVGGEMTSNPLVKKLSFTGSTATGALLMQQAAGQIKKVSLELGGNAPFIVFDDADIDAAVQGAIAAKFRNAGQTCVCTNRCYAHAAIYDAFVEKFSIATKQLTIGNGADDGVLIGPMINAAAVDKTERHLRDAIARGGTLHTGGERMEDKGPLFFAPTVISGAQPDMMLAKEETFGPLAAVFKFDDEASVIAAANDTDAGLAAYLYTRDLGRAWRVGEALDYGMVGINEGIVSTEVAPFGGIKQSGIGREGSKYGIEDYLNIKYMLMGGLGIDGQ